MNGRDQRIHVAHLIGSTGLYGAERWILALMRGIDSNRINSTLINLVDSVEMKSEVVAAARERGLNAFDFVTGGKFNPVAAFKLSQWSRKYGVDIMHGHGFKSDAVGLLASRIAGCRMMTTPHGWSIEKDWKLQFYERLDRKMFRHMDLVCPLSPELMQGLAGTVDKNRLKLVFNGVDIDEVRSLKSVSARKESTYTIGYIGRLVELKDIPTLFSGLRKLVDSDIDARLVLVGDGPLRQDLEEHAACLGIDGRVEFVGFRSDAAAWLQSFDLFVLPSLSEGIPRCVMEAMAASVPVVASDITGCRNLIDDGTTGLLFSPGDSSDLAAKIKQVMSHPDQARFMVENANRKVEKEFSNRRMAQEYMTIYEELAGGVR